MLPMVEVPETIRRGMAEYRDVFCRDEGFEPVSRYVAGLVISPNKTVQGIYDWPVYDGEQPSRRAMPEAIFEAGWDDDELMVQHRASGARDHQGRGREVISLDWTQAHHDRGPEIHGVTKADDDVEKRMAQFQTVVTAVVSNRELIDGRDRGVQAPSVEAEEVAYLEATMKESDQPMEAVRERLRELVHHLVPRLQDKTRTEIAVELGRQFEEEGQVPEAPYAFDNGGLTLELTRLIESRGKHWVTEIECSRPINWKGEGRGVDQVAAELREQHPERFRSLTVRWRNGEKKEFWAFSQVVRLKRDGSKRRVIVPEKPDLTDPPRCLLTEALYWESGRVMETWSYRWGSETFHEFSQPVTGLESAQVRKEEAVKRPFRLSCVAQSLLQRAPASGSTSERFEFAKGQPTFGQRCRTIAREVLHALLKLVQRLLAEGRSCDQVLEVLMPA
jgi:hypothetical protein